MNGSSLSGGDLVKVPYTISEETTRITSPLRADGTPDYVAALNEKYGKGVTADNNGFVSWLELVGTNMNVAETGRGKLLELLGRKDLPAEAGDWQRYDEFLTARGITEKDAQKLQEEFEKLSRTLWKGTEHPMAWAYLGDISRQRMMEKFVEAAEKPRWWAPAVSANGRMMSMLIPGLGSTREAASVMSAQATLEAANGQFESFERHVVALKRLGLHLGSCPTVIERIRGAGVDWTADNVIGAAAGSGALSEAQCKKLDAQLQGLGVFPEMTETVDVGERWEMLDLVTMCAGGETESLRQFVAKRDGGNPLRGLDAAAVDWNVALQEINRMTDRTLAALKMPTLKEMYDGGGALEKDAKLWEEGLKKGDGLEKRAGESRADYSRRVAQGILVLYWTSLMHAEEMRRRSVLLDQMVHMLLAAGQVKAQTGKWPAALGELVPGMLKEVPRSLYPKESPEELTYTVTEQGARISMKVDIRTIGVGVEPIGRG